jgi:hypothetical protein
MTIPWITWGQGVKKRFAITDPVSTCDTAATALWLLGIKPITPLDGVVVRQRVPVNLEYWSRRFALALFVA